MENSNRGATDVLRHTSGKIIRKFDGAVMRVELQRAGVPLARNIFSYTTRDELYALFHLARNCPPNALALEIGSHLGKSACYLAAGLRPLGGTLICVDTWQNETMPDGERDTFAEFQQNTRGVQNHIRTVRKRSDDLVADDINGQLSLVFIDGDHSYEAVRRDFNLVSQWLADDGTIAFHDATGFDGVSRLIGELLSTGGWVLVGMANSLVWLKKATWPAKPWLNGSES